MIVLADAPELVALANLAGVAPSKLAAGFNDAENLFTYLGLDELDRVRGACERLGALTAVLAQALDIYIEAAREAIAGSVEALSAD